MQLPVHDPNHPPERSTSEVRALALTIQSNLARLRDREAQCAGADPRTHDIQVRDVQSDAILTSALIPDDEPITLSPDQLHLRLHETWGQFCLMCWLFDLTREPARTDLGALEPTAEPHCRTAIEAKHAEVHALYWRIAFEQHRRTDAEYVASTRFSEDQALAEIIPATALGTPMDRASDTELILAAAQHAGMLAVLRWLLDVRLDWNSPALTALDDRPF